MSDIDRRQLLKGVLGALVQAAGTVVLASTAGSTAAAQGAETPPEDVQARADRLAACGDGEAAEANEFLNAGFRNGFGGLGGGFRNNAWRNGGLGGIGGIGGGFRNNAWSNGGLVGGFRNGGWPNVGWRNWWG